MKLEFPQPTKRQIEDKLIFSSVVIGDHAKEGEELSLFTTPIGQRMPQAPRDAHRCEACHQPVSRPLTEVETNMVKPGELGEALGDARFDKIRAVLTGGDPTALDASFTLRVCGKMVLETTLAKLVSGWVQLEDEVPTVDSRTRKPGPSVKAPYVLVARTDLVEGRLTLLREAKIAGDPVVIRIEIAAKVAKNLMELPGA